MREILHDGETLPLAFDEWEKNAESKGTAAKRDGVNIIPVFIKPDEFFSVCQEKKIAPSRATALQFHRQSGVWISRNAHHRCSVGRTPLLVFSVLSAVKL